MTDDIDELAAQAAAAAARREADDTRLAAEQTATRDRAMSRALTLIDQLIKRWDGRQVAGVTVDGFSAPPILLTAHARRFQSGWAFRATRNPDAEQLRLLIVDDHTHRDPDSPSVFRTASFLDSSGRLWKTRERTHQAVEEMTLRVGYLGKESLTLTLPGEGLLRQVDERGQHHRFSYAPRGDAMRKPDMIKRTSQIAKAVHPLLSPMPSRFELVFPGEIEAMLNIGSPGQGSSQQMFEQRIGELALALR